MKILLIVAHPAKDSFNVAISDEIRKRSLEKGHEIQTLDIYDEWFEKGFEPVLLESEIKTAAHLTDSFWKYCSSIGDADGIIVVHPNWWDGPPALLKGYLDRVLRPGVAYKFENGVPVGLLKAKFASVLTTSHSGGKVLQSDGLLRQFWEHSVFAFCGVRNFDYSTMNILDTSNDEREAWIDRSWDMIAKQLESANRG